MVLRAEDVHVHYRIRMARVRVAQGWTPRRPRVVEVPRELHAVRGVSLQLRAGECLGIVGDNGAGKSSLLRALGGFEPLAGGAVHVASAPRLLAIGGVTRPTWTGSETIEAGLRALRVPPEQRRDLTEDIVAFTELGDRLDAPVSTYSRGMQGRLQFALNTAVPAQILCIDEGLGGADGRHRAKAQERIAAMLAGAGAMVLVSHSLPLIERLATHAVWLHEGRVVLAGPPADVIAGYEDHLKAPKP